jgi:hypothetical protein
MPPEKHTNFSNTNMKKDSRAHYAQPCYQGASPAFNATVYMMYDKGKKHRGHGVASAQEGYSTGFEQMESKKRKIIDGLSTFLMAPTSHTDFHTVVQTLHAILFLMKKTSTLKRRRMTIIYMHYGLKKLQL